LSLAHGGYDTSALPKSRQVHLRRAYIPAI
jgi:hypothetical protein